MLGLRGWEVGVVEDPVWEGFGLARVGDYCYCRWGVHFLISTYAIEMLSEGK